MCGILDEGLMTTDYSLGKARNAFIGKAKKDRIIGRGQCVDERMFTLNPEVHSCTARQH